MHLLPVHGRTLDQDAEAVALDLTPADILVLSFTDTDLAVAAAAWDQDRAVLPSLRLVNISRLRHPFSVDTFVETLAGQARFVLLRLLGGLDYWRYGVEELAAAARRRGFAFAALPGDMRDDPRLTEASTLPPDAVERLWAYFQAGGVGNVAQALRFVAAHLGSDVVSKPPTLIPAAGLHPETCRPAGRAAPHALILFYRSVLLASDIAPVAALADALAERGARVSSVFVTSLKDPEAAAMLEPWLNGERPDVILNTTAFSARDGDGGLLDRADVPVLQAILAGSDRDSWAESARGLRAADLAMNVVLPEVDGRIAAGAISFKAEAPHHAAMEFTRIEHRPDPDGIAHAADLALRWATLGRIPRTDRRIACILADYPGKTGRAGYAVGLDTPASVVLLGTLLRDAGFAVGPLPPAGPLMQALTTLPPGRLMGIADYRAAFGALPATFRRDVEAAWGDPSEDPDFVDGALHHRFVRAGALVIAVQPDRGARSSRRADHHDAALPPRHGYVAFYLWLHHVERCHAMINLGTHGTLEWLPGKVAALSRACAPAVLTGAMPVIYPFIVNNPGEAAQAKRRIGAVTIGHLTPPLVEAGTFGDTADLERLFDEYAEAATLDPRRAKLLSRAILNLARARDLMPADTTDRDPADALASLDAWLCDIKEMRIGDGLHVFGQSPDPARRDATVGWLDPAEGAETRAAIEACGPSEQVNLLRALDGRFVPPGPAGAPARGRLDVLPTGRNLFAVDPRAVPTRTAWDIGSRMAEDLVTRYAQDHGDWPRRVVLDLWGSATMRTGGDDLAQAFALIGVRPRWDAASTRVCGFDILPLATLGRSRVDVTLRVSGLFRDTFPDQMGLFDAAVRTVASLDEDEADNPLAEARRSSHPTTRVFGTAPGAYGVGIARSLNEAAETPRAALGETYLAATSHGFGPNGVPCEAGAEFRARVAAADAFSHTGDLPGQDVLGDEGVAEHAGGFAAAAALLGATPALYHADTSRPEARRLRSLPDEISRAVAGRATNPRWLAGQMRHGYRGAAAIVDTLDALFAFAATTDAVPSRHFDRYFDATLGDDVVRAFMDRENPLAARAMAEKFAAAQRCGYWISRRNAPAAVLDEMLALGGPGR